MATDSDRDLKNLKALQHPQPGDYWQELFCPYFIVVDADHKQDRYTVLSCMGGPDSYNRKDEPNARIDHSDGWSFDYSKSMVVNRDWMARAVRYASIDGFVADVVQGEKMNTIVKEWREYKRQAMLKQIETLEAEYERFTGWKYLKEGL